MTRPEPSHSPSVPSRPPLRGLVVDWGGVLTPSLDEAMAQWARSDGVDYRHFREVLHAWVGPRRRVDAGTGTGTGTGTGGAGAGAAGPASPLPPEDVPEPADQPAPGGIPPGTVAALEQAADSGPAGSSPVHRLERGEVSPEQFERQLAGELTSRGSPVEASGLLGRLLKGLDTLDADMVGLVRRARAAGLRTALLSNSWGDHYPDELWDGLFDATVISGRVGMRKPDPEIFRHAAELLGLRTAECVMVDDLPHNIEGAVATGMVGVLHRSYDETLLELEAVFDRRLH
jgi:putative hydrolase of the HAD superfamily